MECFYCHGVLERGTAPFDVTRHGYHIHFDAVPAWVCSQCGEPLFDGEIVELIEQALDALDEQGTKMNVRPSTFIRTCASISKGTHWVNVA